MITSVQSESFCVNCHIGSLRACRATFCCRYDGQLLVMPGVPAQRCDFCGEIFYDHQVLDRLALLLGSDFGLENRRHGRVAGLDESWGMSLGRHRIC